MEKLSNNHPDQDSASELACFDVSSLEEAKETCANQQDCNGFWRYDAGRTCFKNSWSSNFSRIILNGSFYGHEFVHPDLSAGISWKAVYTVSDGEEERDTSFSIDFKDIAGNEGVSKDQTDVSNTIKIDTSIPTLSVVSLSGGTNNLANEGDVVTLSFTGSEKLRNPLVELTGERQEFLGTQQTWSTTYTVQAKDDAGRSPYGMEELVLWLDASNIDGRYNESLSDGDKVAEWIDLSGNGNDASQSDSGKHFQNFCSEQNNQV